MQRDARRRGQAATEFVMTYGWAILAVMVAIGALAYFGVLNPSKYLPERCLFTTGFNCRDHMMLDDGTALNVSFQLENKQGKAINISGAIVTAKGTESAAICTPSPSTVGSDALIGFTCKFAGYTPGKGKNVKVTAQVNYTTIPGTYSHIANGDIQSTVQ